MISKAHSKFIGFLRTASVACLCITSMYSLEAADLRGLYLHGGMVTQSAGDITIADGACGTPVAYFGCGNSAELKRRDSFSEDGGLALTLGLGFRVNADVRAEFTILSENYFPHEGTGMARTFLPIETPGRTVAIRRAFTAIDIRAYAANVYYDFPEFTINNFGSFRPFVGIGVGQSTYDMKLQVDRPTSSPGSQSTRTTFPEGQGSSMFLGFYVGVTRNLTEALDLDISWQYLQFGDASTADGVARVRPHNSGGFEPIEVDVGTVETELTAHGLGLSLRYKFN